MSTPECCGEPMIHNSFTSGYECSDAYWTLVDDGVFSDDPQLPVDAEGLNPSQRAAYEHWAESRRPDGYDLALIPKDTP